MKKEFKICIGIVMGIILIFGVVITMSLFSKSLVDAKTINLRMGNDDLKGFFMSYDEFKEIKRELSVLNRAGFREDFIVELETTHQLRRIADALERIVG